ncbi:hypothetical protein CRYUN_Cryun23aG0033600 [Craigia yunnanensis]
MEPKNPDESKQQAESCKQKKRGRPPKLTEEERKERKWKRNRNYRKAKNDKLEELKKKNEELKNEVAARGQQKQSPYESKQEAEASSNNSESKKRLEEKNEELEKEKGALQFKINKELSEIKARADKLLREVSDESKKVKMAGKVLESGMQKLQQNILDSDDQEDRAENCEFDIPMDDEFFNSLGLNTLGNFSDWQDTQSSKTKGLQVHDLALRDRFMNILAEVYKMAMEEKHTLEEIKSMEEHIKDLELAGLGISWLKDLVKVCREVVQKGKNKKH